MSSVALPLPFTTAGDLIALGANRVPVAVPARTKAWASFMDQHFGLVADGVAVETAKMQAVIDETPEGGVIYAPERNRSGQRAKYRFEGLTIPRSMAILGDGGQHVSTALYGHAQWVAANLKRGGTIFESVATSGRALDARLVTHGNTSGLNLHLSNIMFLGIGDATRTTIGIDAEALGSSGWRNVQAWNFATGVRLTQVLYSTFDLLLAKGCTVGLDIGNLGQAVAGEASSCNTFNQFISAGNAFGTVIDQSGRNIFLGGAWQNTESLTGAAVTLQNASEENYFIIAYFENVYASGGYALDIGPAPNDNNWFQGLHLGRSGDRIRSRGNYNWFHAGKTIAVTGDGDIDLSGGSAQMWVGRDLGNGPGGQPIIKLGSTNYRQGGKGSGEWGTHGGLVTNTARQSECVRISTKVANATLSEDEALVHADCTSGTFTITLPTAASSPGRRYTIKRVDGSGNSVIVDGNGSDTIDGAATKTLGSQYAALTIVSNGSSNWDITSPMGTIT